MIDISTLLYEDGRNKCSSALTMTTTHVRTVRTRLVGQRVLRALLVG